MYWIYLALFILAVLVPKMVQEGKYFFQEEDVEALLIFGCGILGFFLYLAKEKALLKVFQEKLHLQKQTNIITRDLSDSYSYIGEMNRRLDIVKELLFRLPKDTTEELEQERPNLYRSLFTAVRLMSKAQPLSLRFVNTGERTLVKVVEEESLPAFSHFGPAELLNPKKNFWEELSCAIVRSPWQARGVAAFLIFPKAVNRVEDIEMFKILASEALFLFCVEQDMLRHEQKLDAVRSAPTEQ